MIPTGPLFKWFGSKWLSSKRYPKPVHDTIVEPYAGSAGYSLRYADRKVIIAESNVYIWELWNWLIGPATEADIRAIPVGLREGASIRYMGLSAGQMLLLKHWQRTNNVGDCWTISPWCNKPGQWTENTRARVAEEVQCVKHWEVRLLDMQVLPLNSAITSPRTYFIDPPYEFNYQYKSTSVVYSWLGKACKALRGQVIVCEAAHPKTGEIPKWLPFEPWEERITSRRKAGNHTHSKECIYVQTMP